MKIRPLPDIDLARIAPMQRDQKYRSLFAFKEGRPPYSYEAVRRCSFDIYNIQPEMFGPAERTAWSVIDHDIAKFAKKEEAIIANRNVARSLYNFSSEHDLIGKEIDLFPMKIGGGRRIVIWNSVLLNMDGRLLVPFLDPRKSKGLSELGLKFAFSVMHEHIREADPDFDKVVFGVFKFPAEKSGSRKAQLVLEDDFGKFSFDQLDEMVAETYEIWIEVCEEREEEVRKSSGGSYGPLFR